MNTKSIVGQISELNSMSMPQLVERWKAFFTTEPPMRNRAHLIKRLAYRIQELAYGGLSEETKVALREVVEAKPEKPVQRGGYIPGTRYVREWQGERHEVTQTREGYEYRGKPYKSLSAIARTITGTRWNGPVFFGLRKQERTPLQHAYPIVENTPGSGIPRVRRCAVAE